MKTRKTKLIKNTILFEMLILTVVLFFNKMDENSATVHGVQINASWDIRRFNIFNDITKYSLLCHPCSTRLVCDLRFI